CSWGGFATCSCAVGPSVGSTRRSSPSLKTSQWGGPRACPPARRAQRAALPEPRAVESPRAPAHRRMLNIGPLELIVILVIALLVVGPRRLPEVGRSIGRGIREFRKAQEEVQKTIQSALNEEPASTARSAPTPDGATPPEGQAVADGGEGTEL